MAHYLSKSLSIRQYLLLVILAIATPMVILLAYLLHRQQLFEAKSIRETAEYFSSIIAADSFRVISDSRAILQNLAQRPLIQQLDRHQCDPLMAGIIDVSPRFANLVVLDIDGRVVCSTNSDVNSRPVSLANTEVFIDTKKTNRFYLGFPHKGPLSGKLVLAMAQAIQAGDQSFKGLIGFSLDLKNYHLLPENTTLPVGLSVVALADNNVVVARTESSLEQVGTVFSDVTSLRRFEQQAGILKGGADSAEGEVEAGKGIIVASVKVGDIPWRIIATYDDIKVSHSQRKQMLLLVSGSLLLILMGFVLAYFLARRVSMPLQQMARVVREIAHGEKSMRLKQVGPKELREVATQFNYALEVKETASMALQASEQRFRSLVEWSPECIGIHRAGRIVFVNPAAMRLLGAHTIDELIGMPMLDRVHPDYHRAVLERIRKFEVDGFHPPAFAEKFIRLDGTVIDVEVQSLSIVYEGEPAFYVNIRDLSESNRNLVALSESEFRWKFAIEGAGEGLWDWDIPKARVFFSERFKEMFGFDDNDFSSELSDWERRIHPEDRERTWALMRSHIEGTTFHYESEHRVLCKDGSWKWIIDRGLVVSRNAAGLALRMIGTHTDVSERVERNLLLQAAVEKNRNLESALNQHAIVAITDAHGTITHANSQFCAISQYEEKELIGQNHRIINSGFHSREFMRLLWRTISQGDVWKGEIKNCAKDGTFYWVDTTIVPFLNAEGKVQEYFAIRRDITEQKRLLLVLQDNAEQMRALAANQSRVKEDERKRIAREIHDDLGGTLSGIKAYLSVLLGRAQRQENPDYSVLLETSSMTELAIETVRKLINELRPSVLDHLGIWAALESHAAQTTQRTELEYSCVIDASLDGMELDADASTAAFRIVQELTTNVLRHAHAKHITLRASYSNGWATIEFEDDGRGMQIKPVTGGKSWGIVGMMERAQQCHGDLVIREASHGGTLAILRLPLGQSNAAR